MYTSYRSTGWERGHHGSPFMLVAGLLVVAAIFKSGLWLPLLGLGLLAFVFTRMHGGWGPHGGPHHGFGPGHRFGPHHGFGPRHGFGPFGPHHGDDKPKRPFGPMDRRPWYGQVEPEDEKPKRDHQDDEFV